MDGSSSSCSPVLSGVPQGTSLGISLSSPTLTTSTKIYQKGQQSDFSLMLGFCIEPLHKSSYHISYQWCTIGLFSLWPFMSLIFWRYSCAELSECRTKSKIITLYGNIGLHWHIKDRGGLWHTAKRPQQIAGARNRKQNGITPWKMSGVAKNQQTQTDPGTVQRHALCCPLSLIHWYPHGQQDLLEHTVQLTM